MNVRERFAKRLKDALEKEGLTQKELARKAGLSEAYVSQIITGKKTPTITVAKRIAEALGLSVSYFLDNGLDIRVLLRKNKELTEEDVKAVEAFIDYLIEKKNNEHR